MRLILTMHDHAVISQKSCAEDTIIAIIMAISWGFKGLDSSPSCLEMDEGKGIKLRYTASQKLKHIFSKETFVYSKRYENQDGFADSQW